MAQKSVYVCDSCGRRIGEEEGASMHVKFWRGGQRKRAELCRECAIALPGRTSRRRDTPT